MNLQPLQDGAICLFIIFFTLIFPGASALAQDARAHEASMRARAKYIKVAGELACNVVRLPYTVDEAEREARNQKILRAGGYTKASYAEAARTFGVISAVNQAIKAQSQRCAEVPRGERALSANYYEGKFDDGGFSGSIRLNVGRSVITGQIYAKVEGRSVVASVQTRHVHGRRVILTGGFANRGDMGSIIFQAQLKGAKLEGELQLVFKDGKRFIAPIRLSPP